MATASKKQFRQIERQHRRLRECIEEAKRLNEMARQLLQKYRETRESPPDR